MTIVTGIVVYAIIWWTVLFAVLPWGVRPEVDDDGSGRQRGAPENPRILRKFLITTLVTTILWIVVYLLVSADIFSFRDWVAGDFDR